ncbi:uncharacterized protein LOC127129696 [Lathyrus oleraceus]|uniref:uncharacterized protein LOC127129696 n=1 Tax=Pisum sativum TaxID=3888 RepID=UPI0021D005C8|nr:uncharacterized protein LOC127129696 [Pisum sativum]
MSQSSCSTPSKSSKEQSNPKNIDIEIELFDVINDVVPLSVVPVRATPMRKDRTSCSRKGKPTKVSTYSTPSISAKNMNDPKPPTVVKKPMSMTSLYLDPINIEPYIDVSKDCPVATNVMKNVEAYGTNNKPRYVTTLSKSSVIVADRDDVDKNINKERYEDINNELGNKEKNHTDQPTDIVNFEELDSDDIRIRKKLAPGIAKRLKNRKGQVVGSSNTPSKSARKKASDIISTSIKYAYGKKIPANIPEVPRDNISFHSTKNVEKWKFVYQRRLALERELGKDVFESKKVLSLIQEAGLMKTITCFVKVYKILIKEFIMNISKECDNKRSKEFRKVYVRGRRMDFSPEIINRFLGRNKEDQVDIEVSDNVICREITAKQVKE